MAQAEPAGRLELQRPALAAVRRAQCVGMAQVAESLVQAAALPAEQELVWPSSASEGLRQPGRRSALAEILPRPGLLEAQMGPALPQDALSLSRRRRDAPTAMGAVGCAEAASVWTLLTTDLGGLEQQRAWSPSSTASLPRVLEQPVPRRELLS